MLPGTTFTIPDGHWAMRGTPDALVTLIENHFAARGNPLPCPVLIFWYDGATEPVERFHVWVYVDHSPELQPPDSEFGVDYLPAGYEILP